MSISAAGPVALASLPRMLARQTLMAFIALLRVPAFTISGLALPVMFYAFFGLPNLHHTIDGVGGGVYLLGSFGAYSMSSLMVFNFGIGVAQERGGKVDLLMRATPLPPPIYLLSKLIVAVVFALIALLLLIAFAVLVGGVRIPLGTVAVIVGRLLLGSIPFIGMGFAIGYGFGASAAPGITNLIYLPMSFASGIFIPLTGLPEFVQRVAPYLPTYHFGQLAWISVGARHTESLAKAALGLSIWTLIFFAIALRSYRAEEERKFG